MVEKHVLQEVRCLRLHLVVDCKSGSASVFLVVIGRTEMVDVWSFPGELPGREKIYDALFALQYNTAFFLRVVLYFQNCTVANKSPCFTAIKEALWGV